MAYDNNSVLQSLVTTTTDLASTAFDLKTGTPARGMTARVLVTAYSSTGTAGSTFQFKIQHSSDNTTYTDLAYADPLTGATAAASAELFITFRTPKRWIRLFMDNVVTSGTPSIAYLSDLGLNVRP